MSSRKPKEEGTDQGRDPIFGIPGPLLFAHRGGAGEAPESTVEAFRHAVDCYAEVLEIDLRLTSDKQIVVWHGPGLEKMHKNGSYLSRRDKIWKFTKKQLDDYCVAHPTETRQIMSPDRRVITLEQFVHFLIDLEKNDPEQRTFELNVELKGSGICGPNWWSPSPNKVGDQVWDDLLRWLKFAKENAPNSTRAGLEKRIIVVASANPYRLWRFRRAATGRGQWYRTNVPSQKVLTYQILAKAGILWIVHGFQRVRNLRRDSLKNWAFETSHATISRPLVQFVHRKRGGIYVFLTAFGLPALDKDDSPESTDRILEILDMGVDGLMTDYPCRIRRIVDRHKGINRQWLAGELTNDGRG